MAALPLKVSFCVILPCLWKLWDTVIVCSGEKVRIILKSNRPHVTKPIAISNTHEKKSSFHGNLNFQNGSLKSKFSDTVLRRNFKFLRFSMDFPIFSRLFWVALSIVHFAMIEIFLLNIFLILFRISIVFGTKL